MPDAPISLGERARSVVARGLARLPGRLQLLLAGGRPVTVDWLVMDPGVQLVRAIRRRRRAPGFCEPTVERARARFRRECLVFRGARTRVGSVHDFAIPGDDGALPVRHYVPEPGDATEPRAARPLVVYLHGGGFVIGDLDTHDEACRLLCRESRMHVLSVAYRLAPEHPFPAALDDALAALRWASANVETLGARGVAVSVVAIGGDDAGGNLATVAARIATRETPLATAPAREAAAPIAQLLIYPITDAGIERRSDALFGEGYFLDARDRVACHRHYLSGTGSSAVRGDDPRVAPLRATDLEDMPPALLATAGFDILRDEGEAYVGALRAAGSVVRHRRYAGLGHGFLHMTDVAPGARRAVEDIAHEWRILVDRAVGAPDAEAVAP